MVIQAGNTVLLLPLIISTFQADELGLWLLLGVLTRVRDIFDFGLLVTVSRHVAQCKSNRERASLRRGVKVVFSKVNLVACVLLPIFYFFALYKLIKESDFSLDFLFSSLFFLLSSVVYLKGNYYRSYIIGVNRINVIKFNEAIINLLLLFLTAVFILLDGGILAVSMLQFLAFLALFYSNFRIFSRLTGTADGNASNSGEQNGYHRYDELIFCSKREFFSGVLGSGFLQTVNVMIANIYSVDLSNVYLILDRLMEQIKNFSRVVFYTSLPSLSKSYARGQREWVRGRVYQRFNLSLFLMSMLCILVLGLGLWLENLNDVRFTPDIWLVLFGFAIIERLTSMYNQLYLISHVNVISHIGMLVTIPLFFAFFSIFNGAFGVASIPLSFMCSYLSFYYPFCSIKARKKLGLSFFHLDFLPMLVLVIIVFNFLG
ncbi:hypothetical protein [Agarivorans sp. OAG1]|uniref:hypothetical protein n=1 Tax=Agarivorans sp. OAG1 TaxID=3082387 RepID=UPI0030CDC1DD